MYLHRRKTKIGRKNRKRNRRREKGLGWGGEAGGENERGGVSRSERTWGIRKNIEKGLEERKGPGGREEKEGWRREKQMPGRSL